MAGLSAGPRGRSGEADRGQLILVAAFALAVTFVTLAVVVNSAIFTQNLATRGDTGGGSDALQTRSQVEASVGDLLASINKNSSLGSADLRTAVNQTAQVIGSRGAMTGQAINVTYLRSSSGVRVFDNNNFSSATLNTSWRVARNVEDTREFDILIRNKTTLPTSQALALEVNATTGGQEWVMDIWQDLGTGEVVVEVTDASGTTGQCRAAAASTRVTINVTDGELAGRPCFPLTFARGLTGRYDIYYDSNTTTAGRYSLLVNGTAGTEAPNDESAIYSTRLRFVYHTTALQYETDIRVAPGEPDD